MKLNLRFAYPAALVMAVVLGLAIGQLPQAGRGDLPAGFDAVQTAMYQGMTDGELAAELEFRRGPPLGMSRDPSMIGADESQHQASARIAHDTAVQRRCRELIEAELARRSNGQPRVSPHSELRAA